MRITSLTDQDLVNQAVGRILRGGERVVTIQKMEPARHQGSQYVNRDPSVDPTTVFRWNWDAFDTSGRVFGD